jgi:drug/metabolite transporter (DMT)-like permease
MIKPGLFWGFVAPLACVVIIAIGQLLFKLASISLNFRRPWADIPSLGILVLAFALYGASSLLWVAALKHAPLSRLYPLMALSFVLVPLASQLVLREPLSPAYWAGSVLILVGLAVISRSWAS